MALLEFDHVSLFLDLQKGRVRILNRISFTVRAGENVAVVGESGSGKSFIGLTAAGLLQGYRARVEGAVYFDGLNVLNAAEKEMRPVRGRKIGYVFQNPAAALNPVLTIGFQVREAFGGLRLSRSRARVRALELLAVTGIDEPERIWKLYPHQLSSGMCQRVVIAMALALEPKLLIADEPTALLDVTVKIQVLDLLQRLQQERDYSCLLISHDLGLVSAFCDRVLVVYAGEVVEQGPLDRVFDHAGHPYTRMLLRCAAGLPDREGGELPFIPGEPPEPHFVSGGCSFVSRCPQAVERCLAQAPPPVDNGRGHVFRCWRK
ncbi:MAG: ABC transporter ATP-binding protein [Peptococcaceae bacterium]|nr:MAG: ABC transporter ATP-binding protein [Peptococcaceae bacterium]